MCNCQADDPMYNKKAMCYILVALAIVVVGGTIVKKM